MNRNKISGILCWNKSNNTGFYEPYIDVVTIVPYHDIIDYKEPKRH